MMKLQHEEVLGTSLKTYFIWKFLGEGSTSKVYLAINEKSMERFAIKVIPKQYLNSDKKVYELVKTEIFILKNHKNQNIIRCLEVFQSPVSIFIVMEYCDSIDLEHYLKSKKYLSEDNAVMFLRQILNGFKGLHELNMMHRDFKLANILLNTNKICKIADLGFAKKLQQGSLTESILGTYITMAPQVIKGKPYGLSADIWSIGVVLYQMIFGEYPYKALNEKLLLKTIQTKELSFSNVRVSRECQDFILACLQQQVSKRITWPQIYKHPLIIKNKVEMIYGIFVPKIQYHEASEFYHRKTEELENFDSINLDQSFEFSRKAVINDCIEEKAANGRESFEIFRTSIALDEEKQGELKCAKKYIMYLNSLSHPCKFLTRRSLSSIDAASFQNLCYLEKVYKKVEHALKQYSYIVNHKVNLFKMQEGWSKFIGSKYYSVISQLIDANLKKVEYCMKKLDRKVSKKMVQTMEKVSNVTQTTKSESNAFDSKVETKRIMKQLVNKLKSSKNQMECDNIIVFLEALFFSVEHEGRTAEQFDMMIARRKSIEQSRIKLVKKIEGYITKK